MKRFSILVKYLQSQLYTNQHLPYPSDGSLREVASNTKVPLVKAMICNNGLKKLDAAYLIFRTPRSVSLKPLWGIVVSSFWDVAMLTIIKHLVEYKLLRVKV